MRIRKAQTFAGLLALMFVFGLFGGGASAAPGQGAPNTVAPPDERVHISGRVDAITDRGVTMTTRRGEILVRVDRQTRIMVQSDTGCVEGTLRGLRVGGVASVTGLTTDQRGVILGRVISQCRQQDADKAEAGSSDTTIAPDQRVRIVGVVNSVSADGVSMTVRGGQAVRVRVSERTVIKVEQRGDCVVGSLRGLQVGSPASVAGVTTRERGVILAHGIAQCRPK